ncbi:hypothetical protein PR048_021071 [Dryococelus australis]|uniref:Uncharacterized protein n=1 Tax=Dryococelus australis TaxID=614101 RepID=A0ABQ9GX74_9NEOP|nr:hypothetical protein PR048_021071 [Dryococelus australis]
MGKGSPRGWGLVSGQKESEEVAAKIYLACRSPCRFCNEFALVIDSRRDPTRCRNTVSSPSSFYYGRVDSGGGTCAALFWGRCGVLVRQLTSHVGEPGSILCGVSPGFSNVGTVPDHATGQRAGFLGDLPFTPPFHSGFSPYSPRFTLMALNTSMEVKVYGGRTGQAFPRCKSGKGGWKGPHPSLKKIVSGTIYVPQQVLCALIPPPASCRSIKATCAKAIRYTYYLHEGPDDAFTGFSRDLPFPPPLHSGAAPYSLQSPSSALKTSPLRAAQISSLTHSLHEGHRVWSIHYQIAFSLGQRSLCGLQNMPHALASLPITCFQPAVSESEVEVFGAGGTTGYNGKRSDNIWSRQIPPKTNISRAEKFRDRLKMRSHLDRSGETPSDLPSIVRLVVLKPALVKSSRRTTSPDYHLEEIICLMAYLHIKMPTASSLRVCSTLKSLTLHDLLVSVPRAGEPGSAKRQLSPVTRSADSFFLNDSAPSTGIGSRLVTRFPTGAPCVPLPALAPTSPEKGVLGDGRGGTLLSLPARRPVQQLNTTVNTLPFITSGAIPSCRGGVVVRQLASYLGEHGSLPGGLTPGFSHSKVSTREDPYVDRTTSSFCGPEADVWPLPTLPIPPNAHRSRTFDTSDKEGIVMNELVAIAVRLPRVPAAETSSSSRHVVQGRLAAPTSTWPSRRRGPDRPDPRRQSIVAESFTRAFICRSDAVSSTVDIFEIARAAALVVWGRRPLILFYVGAAMAERLASSPLTNADQAQSPAVPIPDSRMWESRRAMPLVGSGRHRATSVDVINTGPFTQRVVIRGACLPLSGINGSATVLSWPIIRQKKKKREEGGREIQPLTEMKCPPFWDPFRFQRHSQFSTTRRRDYVLVRRYCGFATMSTLPHFLPSTCTMNLRTKTDYNPRWRRAVPSVRARSCARDVELRVYLVEEGSWLAAECEGAMTSAGRQRVSPRCCRFLPAAWARPGQMRWRNAKRRNCCCRSWPANTP